MIEYFKKLFHFCHWSSCPEELIGDDGCFEYEATCKCGAKITLDGVLNQFQLDDLKLKKANDKPKIVMSYRESAK